MLQLDVTYTWTYIYIDFTVKWGKCDSWSKGGFIAFKINSAVNIA
jgi:hypothetical protein